MVHEKFAALTGIGRGVDPTTKKKRPKEAVENADIAAKKTSQTSCKAARATRTSMR